MIKYRKGRELIEQVADDLSSYCDQGLIDYSKLYKVLRKCNADIGEKINPEKEDMVKIKDYRGYVPLDFKTLNYAFLCKEKISHCPPPPKGFQVEYETKCVKGNKCKPCVSECDSDYVIYQKLDDEWTQFKSLEVTRVNPSSIGRCSRSCPNMFSITGNEFDIDSNGMITTNFKDGFIYFNYVGNLEDDEDDLLILDHPLVEPYYENELIKQILKLALYNKSADVAQLYSDAKVEASRARTTAIGFTNMSEYTEIRNLVQNQRKRFYDKYFGPITGGYDNVGY